MNIKQTFRQDITPRKFLVMIFSYGRCQLLKKMTKAMLEKSESNSDYTIVLSDDDNTIQEYIETFGKEHVYIFNKEQVMKEMQPDTGDAYSMKQVVFYARDYSFKIAQELGYRYFVALDDDYDSLSVREEHDGKLLHSSLKTMKVNFDEMCEIHFRLLDSAPFLNTVALSQGGDYLGGISTAIWKKGYSFKAMNAFFCDTHKPFEFKGRINEDCNAYVINSQRGKLSLTLAGLMVNQPCTQKSENGLTNVYKEFGTWWKSVYTTMFAPNCAGIRVLKHIHARVHHVVDWKYCNVKVLSSSYVPAENILKYSEVMQDAGATGIIGKFEQGSKDFNTVDLHVKDAVINDYECDEW